MHSIRCLALLLFVLSTSSSEIHGQEKIRGRNHEQWSKDIAKLEAQDRENPPPKQAILFVGSSSIRLWDTGKAFPELKTINRGFGGSQLSDSIYFASRIVLKYEPRCVVLYAGDNDLADKVSPEQLAQDFKQFVKIIHDKLPATQIYFLAVKPSTKRWELFDTQKKANLLIAAQCSQDKRLHYVDTFTPMLDSQGIPRKDLLRDDGLHLNDQGYAIWNAILKPLLR